MDYSESIVAMQAALTDLHNQLADKDYKAALLTMGGMDLEFDKLYEFLDKQP